MEPGELGATSYQLAGVLPTWEGQAPESMQGPGLVAALSPTASLWASLLWASVSPDAQ